MSTATTLAEVLRAGGGRSPLTGPLVLAALTHADPADPEYWWPQYEEPVYAWLYFEHVGHLSGLGPAPALAPPVRDLSALLADIRDLVDTTQAEACADHDTKEEAS